MSLQLNQLVACGPEKFRVQVQHIDGEGNLVNDALSWAVATGKKLKIAQVVMGLASVTMVDRLFGGKVSPKVARHDKSVLQHGVLFARDERRYGDIDVVVPRLHEAAIFSALKAIKSDLLLVIGLALRVAKPLLSIVSGLAWGFVRSGPFVVAHGRNLAALFADEGRCRGSFLAHPGTGAFHRAIERVFAVLLAVSRYDRRFVSEVSAAGCAGVVHQFFLGAYSTVLRFINALAFSGTALLSSGARLHLELFSALRTDVRNGHLILLGVYGHTTRVRYTNKGVL